MDNFDLKKFLTENKLTNQTRKLNENDLQSYDFERYLSRDGKTIDLGYVNGWSTEVDELNGQLRQLKTGDMVKKDLDRYGNVTQITYPVNIDGVDYQVTYKIDSSG
jgi:hypothetical protein